MPYFVKITWNSDQEKCVFMCVFKCVFILLRSWYYFNSSELWINRANNHLLFRLMFVVEALWYHLILVEEIKGDRAIYEICSMLEIKIYQSNITDIRMVLILLTLDNRDPWTWPIFYCVRHAFIRSNFTNSSWQILSQVQNTDTSTTSVYIDLMFLWLTCSWYFAIRMLL